MEPYWRIETQTPVEETQEVPEKIWTFRQNGRGYKCTRGQECG